MKRRISAFKLLSTIAVAALMTACATSYQPVPPFSAVDLDAGGRALKTQNLLVILDASSSMEEGVQQWKKFDVATAVVRNLGQTLPENKGLQSGMRVFGGDPAVFKKSTQLIDDVGAFDRSDYEKALATVSGTGGPSPLPAALDAAAADMEGMKGKIALIIVTDGEKMGMAPAENARAIKEKFGDSVCIYPVQVGDAPDGKKLLDEITSVGGCGFGVSAQSLLGGQQMADFVAKIFLGDQLDADGDGVLDSRDKCPGTPAGVKVDADGCPLDSDGDGVADYKDKCPGTPAGVTVDADGCPLDSDGDGVADYKDRCPGTPAGVSVDAYGCPESVLDSGSSAWTFNEINFETAKAEIRPSSYGILDEIAAALVANPQLKVAVEGHTDNTGARAFNMDLSQKRAQSVVDYLAKKGVSPDRLKAKGYGPDRPIADNSTREGRAKNRRVQFVKIN
ncbi:OmpA family protein [uncultured Desulfosarcina sp.]|uniref:OmpA family protein n=1 Tax=uncultured Desulfosarcina sp. TaxID=218289 RepID=UPI0029C67F56|nr:OmpA family protein [uncultured Desulfosarcina sp.]